MRELLVVNICVCLAYSGVALLIWWVVDEWIERPVVKLPPRRVEPFQLGAGLELDKLSVAPLPTP
jgi:hypothetical protein